MTQQMPYGYSGNGYHQGYAQYPAMRQGQPPNSMLLLREDTTLDQMKLPDSVQRSCTDCPCCLLFLAALAGLAYIMMYAFVEGDPSRFLGLPDSQGQYCGITEGVQDKPYLYFCQDSQGRLTRNNTICVSTCPNPPPGMRSSELPHEQCPLGPSADFHTRPLALLCMPTNKTEVKSIVKTWESHAMVHWLLEVGEIPRAWEPILITAAAAIIMGFLYLFFLEKFATCIVYLGLAICVCVPCGLGGYLIYASQNGGEDGIYSTGDSQQDLTYGCIGCLIGFLFLCIACCAGRAVNEALHCIEEAAECISEMPSLLFEPFLALVGKIGILVVLITGFVYLVSCLKNEETDTGRVRFYYDDKEYAFIAYYMFMSLWLMEMCSAMSQFVIAYAVQLWWFATHGNPHELRSPPACATCKGYCVGMTFHLGTLAFGSFIIALVRGLRDLLTLTTKEVGSTGNYAAACICCCCTCCIDLFGRCLRFLSKNAYNDTAINSHSYCKAAYNAVRVIEQEGSAAATTYGASWIFQMVGLGAITTAGAGVCHLLCTRWDRFADPSSEYWVQDPLLLDGVSAVVSFLVASPFMLVFGDVSDTILFCLTIHRMRNPVIIKEPEDLSPRMDESWCNCCPARSRTIPPHMS